MRGLSIASALGDAAQPLRPVVGQTISLYENVSGDVCVPIAILNAARLTKQRVLLSLTEIADAAGIPLELLRFGPRGKEATGGMTTEEMLKALKKLNIPYKDFGKQTSLAELVEVAKQGEGVVRVTVKNGWGSHMVGLQKMGGRVRIVDRSGFYNAFTELPQGQIDPFVRNPDWNAVLIKNVSAMTLRGVPILMVYANAALKLARNMTVGELDQKFQQFKAKRVAVSSSGPAQAPMTVVVVSGDTLSDLAQKYYGSDHYWPLLWDANRAVIGSHPNLVRPGMRLSVPPFSSFSNAQLQDAERRFPTWSKLW